MAFAIVRRVLLTTEVFVAATAAAGGAVLIAGSLAPAFDSVLIPPMQYLDGSPFETYLVPGLLLLVLVGGAQATAAVMGVRRSPWYHFWASAAGFACAIWIYVQTWYIPFSALQLVYLTLGLLQLGLVLLLRGVAHVPPAHRRSTYVAGGEATDSGAGDR